MAANDGEQVLNRGGRAVRDALVGLWPAPVAQQTVTQHRKEDA
ncbi:hypothetical protein [Streptomyces sp. Rer75]|nr:hypothetical protein [Streptomyces sp. Rer75]